MTTEERLDDLEQHVRGSQRLNWLLLIVLSVLVSARFVEGWLAKPEKLVCTDLKVVDNEGKELIRLRASAAGGGQVMTYSQEGMALVELGATQDGHGGVRTFSLEGKTLVALGATKPGGLVSTFSSEGKATVVLGATEVGGALAVFNKTGENVAAVRADEDGGGVVGAMKGKGGGATPAPGP